MIGMYIQCNYHVVVMDIPHYIISYYTVAITIT